MDNPESLKEGLQNERGAMCFSCRFWQRITSRGEMEWLQQEVGLCRRWPPIAVPSSEIGEDGQAPGTGLIGLPAAWPRTYGEDDWCAEWRPGVIHMGRYSAIVELALQRAPKPPRPKDAECGETVANKQQSQPD